MMSMDKMIKTALRIGNESEYIVEIDGIPEKMTYLQLGTYLITNQERIDNVKINLKK